LWRGWKNEKGLKWREKGQKERGKRREIRGLKVFACRWLSGIDDKNQSSDGVDFGG
jgi:hypothetical protein